MILKLSALLVAACAVDLALRRAPAALRHLMWTLTLAGALLLPLGGMYAPRIAGNTFTIRSSAVVEALEYSPDKFNWIVALYAAGVAILLVKLALDILAANRLENNARATSLPGVRVSDSATVPFAWRSIVVPVDFDGSAAVLAHEAAHQERGDVWTMLMARIACAVYWFHPLVWWAAARLRLEADRACDDAVLRRGFDDADYAGDLVEVARSFGPSALAPGAVRKPELEVRVRHILDRRVNRSKLGAAAFCAAVLICLGAFFPLAALSEAGQADTELTFRVGHGVSAPSVLFKVDPEYSKEASAAKFQGTVLLSIVVGNDGAARNIHVVKSAGLGLDERAVAAVRRWKFQPGVRDGKAVNVRATIEVNFRLL